MPGTLRDLPRAYTERRVRQLNVTFARALLAADTANQVAPGVSAGVLRSRPGGRRGRADAGSALEPLFGAHGRSAPDRSAVAAQEVAEVGPGGASSSPSRRKAAGRAASGHWVQPPAGRAA